MQLSIRTIYKITIIASLGSAALLTVVGFGFLYKYLYKTITETEYIISLQREYAIDPLNYQIFRGLVENNEKRKARPEPNWTVAGNPF